jgi:hypothetical protein
VFLPLQVPAQPSKPLAGTPLGVLQLLIRSVDLDSNDSCFLLLKAGPQWGRSAVLSSSNKRLDFNWEVRCSWTPVCHQNPVLVPQPASCLSTGRHPMRQLRHCSRREVPSACRRSTF